MFTEALGTKIANSHKFNCFIRILCMAVKRHAEIYSKNKIIQILIKQHMTKHVIPNVLCTYHIHTVIDVSGALECKA